jgi:hypothetical protein
VRGGTVRDHSPGCYYLPSGPFTVGARPANYLEFSGELTNDLGEGAALDIRRLNDHFKDRHLFESREFRSFNQDRLIRFRADWQEFNGDNFDHLFSSWKAEGPAAIIRQIVPEPWLL